MSGFLQQTVCWLIVYQQEMALFLMISWDDKEDGSQGTQYQQPRHPVQVPSPCHPGSLLSPFPCQSLKPPLLSQHFHFTLGFYSTLNKNLTPGNGRRKTISASFGNPSTSAFMRSAARKCQLWWPKKNVTEVCIHRAGVEKRRQM